MRRVKVDVTIDPGIVQEIDALRGREKRSTFVEHLLKLGLEAYTTENPHAPSEQRRSRKGKGGLK